MSKTQFINIDQLSFEPEIQIRVKIDMETVAHYASCMETEDDLKKFPPVIVFYDGKHYWLADGHHRRAAALEAGHTEIWAEIREGTVNDAIWEAIVANGKQGLGLNIEDRKRAITIAITKWPDRSTTIIAEAVGCHQSTVSRIKNEVMQLHNLNVPATIIGKDGKSYPATRKIKAPPPEAQPVSEEKAQTPVTEPETSEPLPSKNVPCIEELSPSVARTTLQGIRQDDPDHLLSNLNMHFREGYIEDLVIKAMAYLHKKKGEKVTTPILTELNNQAEYLHKHTDKTKQHLRIAEQGEVIEDELEPLKATFPNPTDTFRESITLEHILVHDPETLVSCLFSFFDAEYRKQLILDVLEKTEADDGLNAVEHIISQIHKHYPISKVSA